MIFMGTGCSAGSPRLAHIIRFGQPTEVTCVVCQDAWLNPKSKNKRNNVSIAVAFFTEEPAKTEAKVREGQTDEQQPTGNSEMPVVGVEVKKVKHCLLVDAGKTFRSAVLTHLPRHSIQSFSSLWLTHGHADAILGLDDLREFQVSEHTEYVDRDTKKLMNGYRLVSEPLVISLHPETMELVNNSFAYLTTAVPYVDDAELITRTYVPILRWNVVQPRTDSMFHGLPVHSFPVEHGPGYISLGFVFGSGQFVYISDVSKLPEETIIYLQSVQPIEVLVIDALGWCKHTTHMGVDEALAVVELLKPAATYLVGMTCSVGDHDAFQEQVRRRNPTVSIAYDGLYLDFPISTPSASKI